MPISCQTEEGEWIDCPIFRGFDLEDWIVSIDRFFKKFEIPDVQYVNLAFHHIGVPTIWGSKYEESIVCWIWDEMVEALQNEFGVEHKGIPVPDVPVIESVAKTVEEAAKFPGCLDNGVFGVFSNPRTKLNEKVDSENSSLHPDGESEHTYKEFYSATVYCKYALSLPAYVTAIKHFNICIPYHDTGWRYVSLLNGYAPTLVLHILTANADFVVASLGLIYNSVDTDKLFIRKKMVEMSALQTESQTPLICDLNRVKFSGLLKNSQLNISFSSSCDNSLHLTCAGLIHVIMYSRVSEKMNPNEVASNSLVILQGWPPPASILSMRLKNDLSIPTGKEGEAIPLIRTNKVMPTSGNECQLPKIEIINAFQILYIFTNDREFAVRDESIDGIIVAGDSLVNSQSCSHCNLLYGIPYDIQHTVLYPWCFNPGITSTLSGAIEGDFLSIVMIEGIGCGIKTSGKTTTCSTLTMLEQFGIVNVDRYWHCWSLFQGSMSQEHSLLQSKGANIRAAIVFLRLLRFYSSYRKPMSTHPVVVCHSLICSKLEYYMLNFQRYIVVIIIPSNNIRKQCSHIESKDDSLRVTLIWDTDLIVNGVRLHLHLTRQDASTMSFTLPHTEAHVILLGLQLLCTVLVEIICIKHVDWFLGLHVSERVVQKMTVTLLILSSYVFKVNGTLFHNLVKLHCHGCWHAFKVMNICNDIMYTLHRNVEQKDLTMHQKALQENIAFKYFFAGPCLQIFKLLQPTNCLKRVVVVSKNVEVAQGMEVFLDMIYEMVDVTHTHLITLVDRFFEVSLLLRHGPSALAKTPGLGKCSRFILCSGIRSIVVNSVAVSGMWFQVSSEFFSLSEGTILIAKLALAQGCSLAADNILSATLVSDAADSLTASTILCQHNDLTHSVLKTTLVLREFSAISKSEQLTIGTCQCC